MNDKLLPFEKITYTDSCTEIDIALTPYVGERVLLDSVYREIGAREYIEAAIGYANLATQVDGYRVERKDGTLETTLLSHNFLGFDDQEAERLYICKGIPVERKYGAALVRIAEQQNCFISEVVINGLLTHFEISDQRKLGHSVVAAKDGNRILVASSI